ncbi:hypothetical protein APR12_004159 [Nocardia amikacinitolerans]|uniref:hypothetical protein n=1 Tax=Nocardia amikacinitolerans TaxID=756689 RepID=UPI00082CE8DC|nr:hypothetical protein [Nocardia amikacinitolerans]MCP2318800.1 hypothetical protein [Nocardia amikacinitolerans]
MAQHRVTVCLPPDAIDDVEAAITRALAPFEMYQGFPEQIARRFGTIGLTPGDLEPHVKGKLREYISLRPETGSRDSVSGSGPQDDEPQ